MVNKHITDLVIRQVLDHDVSPGDHAGQSGHLAYVSYTVKDLIKKQTEDNITEITCHYEKDILSEFTWEPDNPPFSYCYEKKIIIHLCRQDNEAAVTDRESHEKKINSFIEYWLLRIEQQYGDNRAPVKFPPYHYAEPESDQGSIWYCFIDIDLGENETLAFVSDNTKAMLEAISSVFGSRFGLKINPDNL